MNLKDMLNDREKFNSLTQSIYCSIPFNGGLGKRSLMTMISDSIDVGYCIDIHKQEVEEFIDVFLDQQRVGQANSDTASNESGGDGDVRSNGSSSNQRMNEGSTNSSVPPRSDVHPDDLEDMTPEELSHFVTYLLKTRIEILENFGQKE